MMTSNDQFRSYRFPDLDTDGEADAHPDHRHDGSRATPIQEKLAAVGAQAYEEGYAQGWDQTVVKARSKSEPFLEMLGKAKAALTDHRRGIQTTSLRSAVALAVAMAGRIVAHEIQRRPAISQSIVRNALNMAAGYDRVKIKIHPEDGPSISRIIDGGPSGADFCGRVEVLKDRSIQRGGCLIETDFGTIDARIDQQLASLENDLQAVEAAVQPRNQAGDGNPDGGEALFERLHQVISGTAPIKACGNVTQVVGLVVEANGPVVQLGYVCDIHGKENEPPVMAEVLGFRDSTVLMMPLEDIRSIGPGSRVVARQQKASVAVGRQLLGRIIDGLGNPIDGLGPLNTDQSYPIYANPINPLLRQRIRQPLDMGVRSINGLLTVGCGQRMGIFSGSGVGKSTLMGMIARKSSADVNVIALIGERGRELNEFIDKELGQEGREKSVVVVATSDHLPLVRVRGAFVATAIAEFFRDQGLHVNLMMDSVTRFAMAQREIGLALGEPPTTKGYTPSVFTLLPKLLERAGTSDHNGTITGLYTVLVEGDDMNEPIADAARSILDGHIVLTRELADQNHYPAIDVLKSVSRVMQDIATLQHKHNAGRLKELLATYRKAEDLINIGAYVSGSNPKIDKAIAKIEQINSFLRQEIRENINFEISLQQLEKIMTT
jgi:flagellum-specific ATP synthase